MTTPPSTFATTDLRAWDDLRGLSQRGCLYRGQANDSWALETSLERCCRLNDIPQAEWATIEQELRREFRRAYHQYSRHVPEVESVLEWLSLMQHYGAPTRLLDFTYSIHIAAYFAVERASSTCAIYRVKTNWAMTTSVNQFRSAGKPVGEIERLPRPFDETSEGVITSLFFTPPIVPTVCPVNPFRLNERLRIQKGIFLAPGSFDLPFEENLRAMPGHDDPANVLRIRIPAPLARQARAELFAMNVTRRTLFPGLDGYAQSLGVYLPVFESDDQLRIRLRTGSWPPL